MDKNSTAEVQQGQGFKNETCSSSQPSHCLRPNRLYLFASQALSVENEPHTFRAIIPKAPLHQEMLDHNVNTIPQLYDRGVQKHYENECLGTRTSLNEAETVIDPNTLKPVKKHELGEYKWKTYREVDTTVKDLSCGLTNLLHLKPKDRIAIFAETREEWFMLAMAAFKKNLTSKCVKCHSCCLLVPNVRLTGHRFFSCDSLHNVGQ